MRIPTEALFIRVVVRRVQAGQTPFRWEIHGAETVDTIYISPDRFGNMEAAYSAGQARLAEFMPAQRQRPEMTQNRFWRSRQSNFPSQGSPALDHASPM